MKNLFGDIKKMDKKSRQIAIAEKQKYSRLRCLLYVKVLVIWFFLGLFGSIAQFRQNMIKDKGTFKGLFAAHPVLYCIMNRRNLLQVFEAIYS